MIFDQIQKWRVKILFVKKRKLFVTDNLNDDGCLLKHNNNNCSNQF